MPPRAEAGAALVLAALAATALAAPAARAPFIDRRSPPAWRPLQGEIAERFELGQLVFNSAWLPAGTPNAARRDGLGPLFVQASCDGCHNNGARGRGEGNPSRLPNSFVMQLGGAPTVHGAVLNTQALPGFEVEARLGLQWTTRQGRYPDGAAWQLREPGYLVEALGYGELPPDTVLRPRIGAALFGAGLLESVPVAQIQALQRRQPAAVRGQIAWQEVDGLRQPGRFGWQADAVSIEDQTALALSREMGLTSGPRAQDDCTALQQQCRAAPDGGEPEVSAQFMQALVSFQQLLAVPARGAGGSTRGEKLFRQSGCADCHAPALEATPVLKAAPQPAGSSRGGRLRIDAYTDLMLHDLGDGLADRTVDGRRVPSLWRTAPLWGMAHAIANGDLALLHDGRAGSVEQAVLWHDGQARGARQRFENLPAADRQALLRWVESL